MTPPDHSKDQNGLPDPRANPYRDDIAAVYLEGKVPAERFVAGADRRLGIACTPVMSKPDAGALQSSELLFGEDFINVALAVTGGNYLHLRA